MKKLQRIAQFLFVAGLSMSLTGCSDPQVYGSIGVSSGYSSYGGYNSGPRMRGSISVGGRIR